MTLHDTRKPLEKTQEIELRSCGILCQTALNVAVGNDRLVMHSFFFGFRTEALIFGYIWHL